MVVAYMVDRRREHQDEAQKVFFRSLADAMNCQKKEASARLQPARLHVKNAPRDLTNPL